jgi:hypothetical protein
VHSDGKALRIVALGVSGGGSLTGPFRDARRFPSTRWYPVPGGYAYDVGVWDLSIVQGAFSVAPCQTLRVTIRDFCIAVCVQALSTDIGIDRACEVRIG